MKSTRLVLALFVGLCLGFGLVPLAAVEADDTKPTAAPSSLDQIEDLLSQSAKTSRAIEKVDEKIAKVEARGQVLLEKRKTHEANRCYFPPGHPEKCQAYDAEAEFIDTGLAALRSELQGYKETKMTLTHKFGMLMARLRIARLLEGLQEWVEGQVVPCTRIPDPKVAQRCLDAAWERHP